VVVDDASTDGTFEIAEQFQRDPRIGVIRHDRNRGKGAALKTALAAVTAPWSLSRMLISNTTRSSTRG
jgi:glycosyltransferase involved in cell wall biosynthesis